jgi:hypothetical protein
VIISVARGVVGLGEAEFGRGVAWCMIIAVTRLLARGLEELGDRVRLRSWQWDLVVAVVFFVVASVPVPGWPRLADVVLYAAACEFCWVAGREHRPRPD